MRKAMVILAMAVAVLVAHHDDAGAQMVGLEVGGGARSFDVGGDLVYSVKYLCGRNVSPISPGPPVAPTPIAAGFYLTAINIHNLNPTGGPSKGAASVLVSVDGVAKFDTLIGAGAVLRLDCGHLASLSPIPIDFPLSTPFVDGFFTLHFGKKPQINVVPVYTVTPLLPS